MINMTEYHVLAFTPHNTKKRQIQSTCLDTNGKVHLGKEYLSIKQKQYLGNSPKAASSFSLVLSFQTLFYFHL